MLPVETCSSDELIYTTNESDRELFDLPDNFELSATGKLIDSNVKPSPRILRDFDVFFRCHFKLLMATSIDSCDNEKNTEHSMRIKFVCDTKCNEEVSMRCASPYYMLSCPKRTEGLDARFLEIVDSL